MKWRSDKRAAMGYSSFVKARLAAEPRCQLALPIALVDPLWHGCTRRSTGLHHLRKRSSAGAIVCEANTLTACNPCNGWVEDFPKLAELAHLAIRTTSPRWADLGARHHAEHHEGTT